MEAALLPRPFQAPPHASTDSRPFQELESHLRSHELDPKVAIATACHCLLHKCVNHIRGTGGNPQSWSDLYQCMAHSHAASPKCARVLSLTQHEFNITSQPSTTTGPDSSGCWNKPTGVWCPRPGGEWYLKQASESTADPTPEQTPKPTEHDLKQASESTADPTPDDLKGESTPAYLTGEIEAPKGTQDMGGWISRVYTSEQQERLHVDKF